MHLRQFRREDGPAAARLFRETILTVNRADYGERACRAWAAGADDEAAWNARFSDRFAFVAEEDGVMTGFGDMRADGLLDRLFVRADRQRRGTGTALLAALEASGPAGMLRTEASLTAEPFFLARGWAVEKRQTVCRRGETLANAVMTKRRPFHLTVYCGASVGNDPAYRRAAEETGRWMADRGLRLVYGGGRTGLMGALADTLLAAGGEAVGVIPTFLETREEAHTALTAMVSTETMAERKTRMIAMGDAFLALPGGPGTLEEIAETYSLRRLGRHGKPVLVYNAAGCYDCLAAYFGAMEAHGFLVKGERGGLHFIESLEEAEAVLREAARK